jgi:tetratricopeptide (TPR) repeat protein
MTVTIRFITLLISFLIFQVGMSAELQLREGGPNDYYSASSSKRIGRVLRSVEKLHLYKGINDFNNHHLSIACDEIDFTLRWFPNHPKGLQFLTVLFDKNSCPNGKTAEGYFDSAIRFRPNDAIAHILYGLYLHKKGVLDKALNQYNIALTLAPESADLHYNLGLLYVELKDYDKALYHAQKAYQIGFPLPWLREKLHKLGVWSETAKKN